MEKCDGNQTGGREEGEGQESGTFLLEGKLPEGRLRQGQPLSVERRDTLLFAYFPALRQRNISSVLVMHNISQQKMFTTNSPLPGVPQKKGFMNTISFLTIIFISLNIS